MAAQQANSNILSVGVQSLWKGGIAGARGKTPAILPPRPPIVTSRAKCAAASAQVPKSRQPAP
eukprot:4805854-Pleurochrysis_carterae.AAC.4